MSGVRRTALFFENMEVSIPDFAVRLQALFFGEKGKEFIAQNTVKSIQGWYQSLPEDWFDNPDAFPDGTPRHAGARSFMYPLGTSWNYELEGDRFSFEFKHGRRSAGGTSNWGLRLQQYGTAGLPNGAIVPVKKKALTLPVTAEARGKTVREFQVEYGRKLFKVGKDDGFKLGTLVWEDPEGELHAAYVLRKRAEVKPLKERRGHDALPSEEQLQEWAAKHYADFLYSIEYID